jgi:hypothetical protein
MVLFTLWGYNMKLKHIIKKETGQAMVEFALILIPLFLIIGGIIDFGWIFHKQLLANNACREAARYVSISYSDDYANSTYKSNVTSKVTHYFNDFSSDANNDINIEINDNGVVKSFFAAGSMPQGLSGQSATIGVIYKVHVLTPFLRAFEDYKVFENNFLIIKSYTTVRLE